MCKVFESGDDSLLPTGQYCYSFNVTVETSTQCKTINTK